MRVPGDELGLVSSLRDAPVAVVKCITNDIRVPADAEYIIEGYVGEAGYVEHEGPYGEFLGYYGGMKRNPVFHVTAIAHRRDALFQTATISGKSLATTDTAQLGALRTEVIVLRALESAVREVRGGLRARRRAAATTPSASPCGSAFRARRATRSRRPSPAWPT